MACQVSNLGGGNTPTAFQFTEITNAYNSSVSWSLEEFKSAILPYNYILLTITMSSIMIENNTGGYGGADSIKSCAELLLELAFCNYAAVEFPSWSVSSAIVACGESNTRACIRISDSAVTLEAVGGRGRLYGVTTS